MNNKTMLWGVIIGLSLMIGVLLVMKLASPVGYAVVSLLVYVLARLMHFDIKGWVIVTMAIALMWGFAFNVQDADVLKQGSEQIADFFRFVKSSLFR